MIINSFINTLRITRNQNKITYNKTEEKKVLIFIEII